MSDTPAVSIVLPVYDTAPYLPACLESLCGQTLRDLEVVCVDDGSTDGSAGILDARAAADPRVRVIHQGNAGVSRARNVGLCHARGSYVLFVDSDDLLERVACERLVARARKDDADIVVFGGTTFPSVAWIDRALTPPDLTVRNDPFAALFGEVGSYPLMCNKLYRRALLAAHDLRFDEGLRLGEDHAFQFCAFPHARVVSFCGDPFYRYRCDREGSAMGRWAHDHAFKAENHLALVEGVLTAWEREGWLAGHESELLTWSCDLLEQDVPACPLEVRERLAPRYRAIAERFGLVGCAAFKRPEVRRRVRFFGGADLGAEPVVSVVAVGRGAASVAENFARLANQSCQALELLCVNDLVGDAATELDELVAAESRARRVASVSEARDEARGAYVLFADLRDAYAWDALGASLELLAAARACGVDPQLATFRDARDVLRAQDLGRAARLGVGGALNVAHDLARVPFSFASLSCANKLWRADLARACSISPGSPASVARALLLVWEVCPGSGRLVELGEREANPGQVADVVAELRELGAGFERAEARADLEVATVACVMGAGELVRDAAGARAHYEAAARALMGSPAQDDELGALLRDGADAYVARRGEARAERLQREVDSLRAEAAYAESRLLGRDEQLAAIRGSASFKAGRALTAAPRGLRSALKSLGRG